MKDLEIRGAGSILGAQQSGHMKSVGYDLYNRILSDAVETLRSKNIRPNGGFVDDQPKSSLNAVSYTHLTLPTKRIV